MSTILQFQAQYESLANQYSQNLDDAAACAARRDEGELVLTHISAIQSFSMHLLCSVLT
jgi:hypothetical protein